MRGDATLFARRDEVEQSWIWVQSLLEASAAGDQVPATYERGSEGPRAAHDLLARDGRRWETL
jgi:glucose-6-phosphate 1-dehydrogenase